MWPCDRVYAHFESQYWQAHLYIAAPEVICKVQLFQIMYKHLFYISTEKYHKFTVKGRRGPSEFKCCRGRGREGGNLLVNLNQESTHKHLNNHYMQILVLCLINYTISFMLKGMTFNCWYEMWPCLNFAEICNCYWRLIPKIQNFGSAQILWTLNAARSYWING